MKTIAYPNPSEWPELLERPALDNDTLSKTIDEVLSTVKFKGDEALLSYARTFDNIVLDSVVVDKSQVEAASSLVSDALKKAIEKAKGNIETFHQSQRVPVNKIMTSPGVYCWRKQLPIERVGIYIPGGSAPLFSTVLMLGIPALLAGCKEIVLCTPPGKEDGINPVILYTANLIGIEKIYAVGGAQAIAAMAYGTESVPQVYKIFGPGNQYVTAAKQWVNREGIAIDMPAGPSEVAIAADDSAVPAFVAADLLSQAEHGADSQVVLVSTSKPMVEAVQKALALQLDRLPRKAIAAKALENSKAIVVKDRDTMLEMINAYAPEHLILSVEDCDDFAEQIVNAGSVFLGNFTPESAGDYASGTNHTLPTNGCARAFSGVSLDSFMKSVTFQKIDEAGIKDLGPTIEIMAEAEELIAHKQAVTLRLDHLAQ